MCTSVCQGRLNLVWVWEQLAYLCCAVVELRRVVAGCAVFELRRVVATVATQEELHWAGYRPSWMHTMAYFRLKVC